MPQVQVLSPRPYILNKRHFKKGAGVAQLVEQLICNQQVGGSSPSTSSIYLKYLGILMGEFPSGQRGQTVNLLRFASMVQIHLLPPNVLHFMQDIFYAIKKSPFKQNIL